MCFHVFPVFSTCFGGRIDVDFEPTCRRECWFDKAGWTHGFKFHPRRFGTFQKSHYRAIGEEGNTCDHEGVENLSHILFHRFISQFFFNQRYMYIMIYYTIYVYYRMYCTTDCKRYTATINYIWLLYIRLSCIKGRFSPIKGMIRLPRSPMIRLTEVAILQ